MRLAENQMFRSASGKNRHARLLVGGGEAGGRPFLLTMSNGGGHLLPDERRGIIGVVVVEVGLDVLGVIEVAMKALAVVLPNQFPVGFNEVIDCFGNFRPRKALRFGQRGEKLPSRFKWRGLSASEIKIRPSTSRAATRSRLNCNLSKSSCMPRQARSLPSSA